MSTYLQAFHRWIPIFMCLVVLSLAVIAAAVVVIPTQAQGEEPPADSATHSACYECHQTEYFLYDNGNWVFFETMHGRCVDCHNGQGDTWDKKAAHAGMIANPLQDNQAACQGCHGKDYQAHMQTMTAKGHFERHGPAVVGNISTDLPPAATPGLAAPDAAAVGTGFQLRQLESWRQAALVVIGLVFIVVFVFGCRCWREDRAALHPAAS